MVARYKLKDDKFDLVFFCDLLSLHESIYMFLLSVSIGGTIEGVKSRSIMENIVCN